MMGKKMGEGGDINVFNSGNIETDGKDLLLLCAKLGGVVATMLSHRLIIISRQIEIFWGQTQVKIHQLATFDC